MNGVHQRQNSPDSGEAMHQWAEDLFPICRSLTGDGVRETLDYLADLLPGLATHEIPTGTNVLDWTVPDEWNISSAFIADLNGTRLIDFGENNLHIVGYSEPFDAVLTRDELEPHLYSLPDQPEAIPYVTSYYRRNWGFCLTERQRAALGDGPFHVYIDSKLDPGALTYADLVIPGETNEEVLISTYVCHPSMANNELSGPIVAAALARWVSGLPSRRFTYRFVFAPETIGSIAYMAEHLEHLKKHVVAGWVVTCIGDDRTYSYLPSRRGHTLADRAALAALSEITDSLNKYSFLDRGSDERQWCSPGADLPICSVMRSKYGTFPEYHTSLDNLDLVTPSGLQGGLNILMRCIEVVETNRRWRTTVPGEPQLGPRGLYPTASYKGSADAVRSMMNTLAYCDGEIDMLEISEQIDVPYSEVASIIDKCAEAGVIVTDD